MTCEKIQHRLSALIDGELPTDQAAEITRHLAHCPKCRAARERLDRLAEVLREVSVPAVPVALSERLLASGRARLTRPQSRSVFRVVPWLADLNRLPGYMKAAASIVLLVGMSTGAWLGLQVSARNGSPVVTQVVSESDPATVLGFDFFADTPQGSLSQAYLDLAAASSVGER